MNNYPQMNANNNQIAAVRKKHINTARAIHKNSITPRYLERHISLQHESRRNLRLLAFISGLFTLYDEKYPLAGAGFYNLNFGSMFYIPR